ncbi:MAG: helix-turn-helix domain-containing protein [Maritimibacter sp.]
MADMTKKVLIMPNSLRIALIDYPGAQQAALLGMADMFAFASRFAADGTAFVTSIHASPGDVGQADVLILPPALGVSDELAGDDGFRDALLGLRATGTLITSVCAGSLLLADCGLLDGRPATTHWAMAEGFRARFPRVALDPARLIVDDGDIITAGGLMAWADLVLHLVGRLHSPELRNALAHYCLIDASGRAQSHYARFQPRLDHGNRRVLKVQHWLAGQLSAAVSIADMAREAGQSERSFVRHFRAATGHPPGEYLQLLRLARAQDRLEAGDDAVARIAWDVGYEDVSAFRRMFQARIGLTPGAYRRRFRSGQAVA